MNYLGLILLFVVVLLAAYVLVFERTPRKKPPQGKAPNRKLKDYDDNRR